VARRIFLSRSTADLPLVIAPDIPQFRIGDLPEDLHNLATVMLNSYRGTPDYEGEDIDDTLIALTETINGKYGAVIRDASLVAYADNQIIAGLITVLEDAEPLVALVFTVPEYAGKGIASSLIAAAGERLGGLGYATMGLVVNVENDRAEKLYKHLGFTEQRCPRPCCNPKHQTGNIVYSTDRAICDEDLRALYDSVGWVLYLDKYPDLAVLLPGCHLVLSAWDGKKLVGLIRTISDGVSVEYIQDLLVHPEYQKHGIGGHLLNWVSEQVPDRYAFVLTTDGGETGTQTRQWYAKNGLIEFAPANHHQGFFRPNEFHR